MADAAKTRLAPLQQQSAPLRNRIIASLRSAIETGLLAPGTRLIEKDLCEQLDVSRTSLREALRELQADGNLEYTSNRSLTVRVISREDAENAYRIRSVLEALVVEQFIEKASDTEVSLLVRESEALKSAYRSGVLERMMVTKRAFYDRICSGAENGIAFDIINRLVLRTSSLRSRSLVRKERQQQSIKEIDALVQAIRRRDVAAARQAALDHVSHAAQSALGPAAPEGAALATVSSLAAVRRRGKLR
ncbi:MAG: GntR family transcriptional regulator [Rhodospirillales bacterium]|jgi:DNA-binding GntR family transcriptional regulator|nr:GntR family transcriptional regulator [Rhodospirillales bacterium]